MELLRFTHKNILKQQQFGSFSQMGQSAASSALQGGLNSVIQGGNFMTGVKGSLASMKPSTGSIVGMAADTISSFLPQKTEYDGDKGHITQSLDGIYDNVSDAIGMVPGWGTAASVIMKGAKVLGQGVNALGGGTDGMCVCAGTKVFTSTGELKNIEDLQLEDGIIGWRQSIKEIVPQKIHSLITTTQKNCLRITLKSGQILECSIDHPILSHLKEKAESHRINGRRIAYRNWDFHRADELKVGNYVALANNIDYWGDQILDKAYLIGLLIGDGTYTKGNSCRLISADSDTWNYIESNNLGVINHCDDSRPSKYQKEVRTYRIINGMDLMRSVGLVYQSGSAKTLPKNLGKLDKTSICQLLAGLYDTDGSINCVNNKPNITLYQSNLKLLEEVKIQLHKLGIFATINKRKAADYELGGKIIHSNVSYRLCINEKKSIINFYNNIKLNITYKQSKLQECYEVALTKRDSEHNIIAGGKQSKIIKIESIGLQTVYNLQADNDHTYLANGIITHNTSTDAVLGSSFLNLTPMGLINGFGGSRSDNFVLNEDAFSQVGSSYEGSLNAAMDAKHKAAKKYGLFSKGEKEKANKLIAEARKQQAKISTIADSAKINNEILANQSDLANRASNFELSGGYDMTAVRAAKEGGKIDLSKIALPKQYSRAIRLAKLGAKVEKPLVFNYDSEQVTDEMLDQLLNITYLEEGGKIAVSEQPNLLPEGALHKNKHHIIDENPELKGKITEKGIPVIVESEGGEVIQQAEVEREELVLRKQLTDKVEEAYKQYYNDNTPKKVKEELATEIGKLLAEEILNNTDDRADLIDKVN